MLLAAKTAIDQELQQVQVLRALESVLDRVPDLRRVVELDWEQDPEVGMAEDWEADLEQVPVAAAVKAQERYSDPGLVQEKAEHQGLARELELDLDRLEEAAAGCPAFCQGQSAVQQVALSEE